MGIRDAIIITLLLSQTLCDAGGRGIATSLLQGLLSSNPQLLKMVSNRFATPYGSCPVQNGLSVQSQQNAAIIQSQKQKCQYPAQYQVYNPQCQVKNVKDVPLVTKETKTVQQTQYPAQFSTVQQTQTAYPASLNPCPLSSPAPMVNPFLPAASPISALCPPTSSLLPPANPSLTRSQFLRKIPIPPPCL